MTGVYTAGACSCTAMPGQVCVVGELFDFLTNTRTAAGHVYRLSAWDPFTFVGGGGSPIQSVTSSNGCYMLGPFPARTPALEAEYTWLEAHWLSHPSVPTPP